MIRVVNQHGAYCCGIQPGEEGEVDEANRGVKIMLAARYLVPVEEVRAKADAPTDADVREMMGEIARRDERIASLSAELRAVEAKNTEAGAEHLRLSMQVEAGVARIAELEAEVTRLKTDLDAASALLKDAGDSAAKKTRATREG